MKTLESIVPVAGRRRKRRILFVCCGNSFRSQIAEAFARNYASAWIEVASAGILPSPRVSGRARKTMAECGVPLPLNAKTKNLSSLELSSFDLIVNLCQFGLPRTATPILQADIPDARSVGDDMLAEIRDEIKRTVLSVAEKLRPRPTYRPILLLRNPEMLRA